MNNTSKSVGRFSWITGVGIGILLIGLVVLGIVEQMAWSHQAELTRSFEACMESAPFKKSLKVPRAEAVLTAAQLQNHFDLCQMLKKTGLPPIWNGQALVPWKEYHKHSIEFAKQCHGLLGIDQPQRQLKGSYSKPAWDPNSPIWQQAD